MFMRDPITKKILEILFFGIFFDVPLSFTSGGSPG